MLGHAQHLGHIGPDLGAQVDHSLALASAYPSPPSGPIVDLGSGGGLPGLVLAAAWPETEWILLDGRELRSSFLQSAVATLGWADRVRVIGERAERVGRGALRGQAAAVIARGFGPPAATAECAAPLLRVGGSLLVTEPPGGAPDRWSSEGLVQLGLATRARSVTPVAYQLMEQVSPCPPRFPRKVGMPAKRPLF